MGITSHERFGGQYEMHLLSPHHTLSNGDLPEPYRLPFIDIINYEVQNK